jgi:hypothetical protein
LAELQEQFVFIGGIDQETFACSLATDDVHVVVNRSNDHLVNFNSGIVIEEFKRHGCIFPLKRWRW